MALTAFVRVRDAGGTGAGDKPGTSIISVEIPLATTPANAIAFARGLADVVAPLMVGGIIGAGVTLEADLSSLSLDEVGTALADIQERAVFAFRTAAGKLKRIGIPTFNENLFTGAGAYSSVDLTDVDVQAFVTAMEDGITLTGYGGTGVVAPVDTNDSDLAILETANQDFSSRRG